ncbi:rhodanese-like domain-containing protein [Heyndrickxia acidicola]|uniref:Rhodanese-like domain-containing protein n=1 Tax=Heyndrickxia acidicola TaxID=209389 RepID=A0ABU6ME03_9BACI|nr:rhodanese-like domain-containing protein [Heyndrickxia acidicola]MED1201512.1 rhodanese-like domain-containing protein [Heyndrickxia acidicola]
MKHLSAKEVQQKLENGEKLNIIDVRETKEVAEGKISSAINIPLGLVEFRKHDLNKNSEYILVCRSGGRSSKAAALLEECGFKVINMDGGMLAWEGKTE